MHGLGTVVNVATILVGGLIGIFSGKLLNERLKDTIMQALALVVLFIGISGIIAGVTKDDFSAHYTMVIIISLVLGTLISSIIDIEKHLENFGTWCEKKAGAYSANFAEGFVTASLVFCVGAMAIVGSLEDGLSGNFSTLFAKSAIDGVAALIFASTLGVGVVFSAFAVGVYQGFITALSIFVAPLLTEGVISQMSITGSLLIMAIGINMLGIHKKIKVGNMLLSVFIPIIIFLTEKAIAFL